MNVKDIQERMNPNDCITLKRDGKTYTVQMVQKGGDLWVLIDKLAFLVYNPGGSEFQYMGQTALDKWLIGAEEVDTPRSAG